MTPTMMIVIGLIALLVIAGLAFALYKAGFRVTKWKIKLPLFEADAERTPTGRQPAPSAETAKATPLRTEASQKALDGGALRGGHLSAPADSGAKLSQKAKGQDSRIDDSEIKLS